MARPEVARPEVARPEVAQPASSGAPREDAVERAPGAQAGRGDQTAAGGDGTAAGALVAAAADDAAGVRCPFCHDTIPFGQMAGACDVCTAPHHPQCFAEHRGCAVAGCAGRSARATAVRPRPDPRPRCATCAQVLEADTWVSACVVCDRRSHVSCQGSGGCTTPHCHGLSRYGTVAFLDAGRRLEAARANQKAAWTLGLFFALMAVVALGAAVAIVAADPSAPLKSMAERGLIAAIMAFLGGGVFTSFLGVGALQSARAVATTEEELRRVSAHDALRPRPDPKATGGEAPGANEPPQA